MKKALAIVLCLVLLVSALPGNVLAASQSLSKQDAVKAEVSRIYTKCRELAQVESFSGYCGLLTSYQLWLLGITEELAIYDGNKQFDAYADASVTSGGYHVTAYPAQEFTLDQALAVITRDGTMDVENIMVGFESTVTEAGQKYGHALMIHTIMDGMVYYVENYRTSIAGEEGNVIVCSLENFVRFYEDWTILDGVVHFGNSRYADSCQTFATDLFVRTRFDSTLRSEPCLLTENDCARLRSLRAGEMLHATAVCLNTRGERYYRIEDGERTGYVAANAVSVVQISDESLRSQDIEIPAIGALGEDLLISGKITADNSGISAIRMTVTDAADKLVMEAQLDVTGCSSDIALLNEQLAFDELKAGQYTVCLYATAACVCVRGANLITKYQESLIHTQQIAVGQLSLNAPRQVKEPGVTVRDGWFLEDGIWHCYKYNKPCTGWVTHLGVDYYLQKDGSVTTGMVEVDGFMRCFSATGALCSGWVTALRGTYYWLPDGMQATGVQEIDGKLYCFDESGALILKGTVEIDGIQYKIQKDGTAKIKE